MIIFFFFKSFLSSDTFSQGEPRVLGLAMIPGHHVVSIEVEADSLEDTQGFGANHWWSLACLDNIEHSAAWLWWSSKGEWTSLLQDFISRFTSTDANEELLHQYSGFSHSLYAWRHVHLQWQLSNTTWAAATWMCMEIFCVQQTSLFHDVSKYIAEFESVCHWQKFKVDQDYSLYFGSFVSVIYYINVSGATWLLKGNSTDLWPSCSVGNVGTRFWQKHVIKNVL